MRCQICNRETNNFRKNKVTGEYESICNRCQNIVRDCNAIYEDVEDDVLAVDYDGDDLVEVIKEIDNDHRVS